MTATSLWLAIRSHTERYTERYGSEASRGRMDAIADDSSRLLDSVSAAIVGVDVEGCPIEWSPEDAERSGHYRRGLSGGASEDCVPEELRTGSSWRPRRPSRASRRRTSKSPCSPRPAAGCRSSPA